VTPSASVDSSAAGTPADPSEAQPDPPAAPLLELSDGLPPLIERAEPFAAAVARFAAASGPVAVDAERASGYRYSSRAYLVQLRRRGAGTALIDPVPLQDLSPLGAALADCEWILHAASQDLACLAEVGLRPRRLFDTELAGRLLGYPRVGLSSLVEQLLGRRMRKEHSAADWSRRPLPEPWLAYAALDVEVLVELRQILGRQLAEAGKQEWAEQEFAALVTWVSADPRQEPWRRTSGIHRVRGRRGLAVVRALWEARDEVARGRDIAPGRLLKDAAIVEIALSQPRDRPALEALPSMRGRGTRRHASRWAAAVEQALRLPERELPEVSARYDGPPPARAWFDRNPAAAARLLACREALRTLAEAHQLPVENLVAPDAVRRLAWEPPVEATAEGVAGMLRQRGAREWQVELTSAVLSGALLG
jgi:ribonuclease D